MFQYPPLYNKEFYARSTGALFSNVIIAPNASSDQTDENLDSDGSYETGSTSSEFKGDWATFDDLAVENFHVCDEGKVQHTTVTKQEKTEESPSEMDLSLIPDMFARAYSIFTENSSGKKSKEDTNKDDNMDLDDNEDSASDESSFYTTSSSESSGSKILSFLPAAWGHYLKGNFIRQNYDAPIDNVGVQLDFQAVHVDSDISLSSSSSCSSSISPTIIRKSRYAPLPRLGRKSGIRIKRSTSMLPPRKKEKKPTCFSRLLKPKIKTPYYQQGEDISMGRFQYMTELSASEDYQSTISSKQDPSRFETWQERPLLPRRFVERS